MFGRVAGTGAATWICSLSVWGLSSGSEQGCLVAGSVGAEVLLGSVVELVAGEHAGSSVVFWVF